MEVGIIKSIQMNSHNDSCGLFMSTMILAIMLLQLPVLAQVGNASVCGDLSVTIETDGSHTVCLSGYTG